jgi:hypothetical protein
MVSHYGHALPYMVAIFGDMAMAIMDEKYSKSIWPYMVIQPWNEYIIIIIMG